MMGLHRLEAGLGYKWEMKIRKDSLKSFSLHHQAVKWSCSVVSDSLWPHRLGPTRLLCAWDFPGNSTRVGFHFLLQGIFLTQGSNPGLSLCRRFTIWPTREAHQEIWKAHQSSQDWKRSFISNPRERQCQNMSKLLYNCANFICYQVNAQNPSH